MCDTSFIEVRSDTGMLKQVVDNDVLNEKIQLQRKASADFYSCLARPHINDSLNILNGLNDYSPWRTPGMTHRTTTSTLHMTVMPEGGGGGGHG
jgi:hypothetical protein